MSGHSSWQSERNGAITTILPLYAPIEVAVPCSVISGTDSTEDGTARFSTMPWFAEGGPGGPPPPQAVSKPPAQAIPAAHATRQRGRTARAAMLHRYPTAARRHQSP